MERIKIDDRVTCNSEAGQVSGTIVGIHTQDVYYKGHSTAAPRTTRNMGAPLRLRCENELGFKMVKWVQAIEFVADFADLGAGNGGYNEDHEFYGYRMPI